MNLQQHAERPNIDRFIVLFALNSKFLGIFESKNLLLSATYVPRSSLAEGSRACRIAFCAANSVHVPTCRQLAIGNFFFFFLQSQFSFSYHWFASQLPSEIGDFQRTVDADQQILRLKKCKHTTGKSKSKSKRSVWITLMSR